MSDRYALSDAALLSAWEEGQRCPPLDRAAGLLRLALPDAERASVDTWSIGQRDACLLDIRRATFGEHLAGITLCSACGEQLDIAFNIRDIRSPYSETPMEVEAMAGDVPYHVTFRTPTSADVQAVRHEDLDTAWRSLAERCVLHASRGGETLPATALPDEVVAAISEAMASHDPQSDVHIEMTCPACGHAWTVVFDIVDFLWREVAMRARQIALDVHTLALAYGWREADILAMSPARRQTYRDLVT